MGLIQNNEMLIPPLLFIPIVYVLHLSFASIITSSVIPYLWVVWIAVFCLEGFDSRNGKRAVTTGFTMLVEFAVIGAILYFIGAAIPLGTLLAGSPQIRQVVSVLWTSIVLSGLSPVAGMSAFAQINYAYIGLIIGTYAVAGYLSGSISRMRRNPKAQKITNPLSDEQPAEEASSADSQPKPSRQPSYIA